ncbi:TolC family protein, partial [Klebsiella pneumoniae]
LSYNYNKGRNNSQANLPDGRGGHYHDDRNYNSFGSTFTLQQPLFDYAAWADYRQGVARTLLADERFRGRSQELAVRLFEAYSQALLSDERIALAR